VKASKWCCMLVLAGAFACGYGVRALAEGSAQKVHCISPPESGFYAKEIDYQGIPIKAPAVVDDGAIVEACHRLDLMLHNMPDAVANLAAEGAELHIIGKDQVTSDLPEHFSQKGKPFDGDLTIDERTRGVGGVCASCGEENLLRLKKDRYFGRDICLHEFAHTVMEYGLDDALRAKIERQYHLSLADGRWKTMYAGTNPKEFWAELTMWYFGTRGDYGQITPSPVPGKDWLMTYDAEAYKLLDNIYNGRLVPARIQLVQVAPVSPSQEGSLRSSNGAKTTLRLANNTNEPVKLYWLDGEGQRKPYGEIPAHQRVFQNTYVSHPFVLTDKNDRGLAIFIAVPQDGIATLCK
jgi:hypothetical protein